MKSLSQYILEKSWDKYQSDTYEDPIKNAIYDYVAGLTVGVNGDLRKGVSRGSKKVIKGLDDAFNSEYASEDKLNVYRTVDWDYFENVYGCTQDNIEEFVGKKFLNKGYMSTTKLFKSPWGSKWTDGELVLHITSKNKVKYLDINTIFNPEEIDCEEQEEILLGRNQEMTLTSYKFDKKKNVYILEMEL